MPTDTPELDEHALKAAVVAALRDNREWLRELVLDALAEADAEAEAETRREADAVAALYDPRVALGAPHGRA